MSYPSVATLIFSDFLHRELGARRHSKLEIETV
ncbi:hypothetical protein BDI4_1080025 [Burkholderia diffusa]|nr:hypothetical protein BDI4_1080025 [Burkholderia diffusa]